MMRYVLVSHFVEMNRCRCGHRSATFVVCLRHQHHVIKFVAHGTTTPWILGPQLASLLVRVFLQNSLTRCVREGKGRQHLKHEAGRRSVQVAGSGVPGTAAAITAPLRSQVAMVTRSVGTACRSPINRYIVASGTSHVFQGRSPALAGECLLSEEIMRHIFASQC